MKKRILLVILFIPTLFISCNKETFPDNEDLKGSWLEISTLMDQEGLYFDGTDTLFYSRRPYRYIENETFIYRLANNHKKLYLKSVTYPGTDEIAHKIQLNSDNNELTIWGLHGSASESTFRKQ
jgi:hypothetical protein